jgi:hypothetical protein
MKFMHVCIYMHEEGTLIIVSATSKIYTQLNCDMRAEVLSCKNQYNSISLHLNYKKNIVHKSIIFAILFFQQGNLC